MQAWESNQLGIKYNCSMSNATIDISGDFKLDDFAVGNLVTTTSEDFQSEYVIVGNGDPATLTLREMTILSGQGRPFRIGRQLVRVTHYSVPVELVEQKET